MVEKITLKNIDKLRAGDVLLKYPITGEPVDKVDLNDKEKMLFMKIVLIQLDRIDLSFMESAEPVFLANLLVTVGSLHKYRDDMIADKTWWRYSD